MSGPLKFQRSIEVRLYYNISMKRRSLVATVVLTIPILLLLIGFNNCSGSGLTAKNLDGSASLLSAGCVLAPAELRNPTTIDQMTKLVNALPKPVSIACVIDNLPKPLAVSSLESTFSAQPSDSAANPRVFIIRNNLILSVVPTGLGKNLLEMSEVLNANESVKAELLFPVEQILPLAAPFDRVKASANASNCNFCHKGEREISGYASTAFSNELIRPDFMKRVTAAQAKQSALTCDQVADPYRCGILRAIFINGQAQDTNFP